MKALIAIIVLCSIILLGGIATCVSAHYSYSLNVGQYLNLADDASVAAVKLDHLREYRVAIQKTVQRNDARLWFTQRQYTRDAQLEILDTLITRLEQMSQMDPKGFEYQTAMQQVSGQEFDHTLNRIDGIFWDCWRRESAWRWFWTILNDRMMKSE
jgi:hypothetical protein